jgi:putative tryptophan/tyrosine transport system substrate-binding protein
MDRRTFIGSVALGIAAAPFATFGQQPLAKVYRIGFIGTQRASDYVTRLEALRMGLRELGYVENRNIVIEFRAAEGKYDRVPGLAAELIGLKVDVLVVNGPLAALAAKHITTTTPIVVANLGDAVNSGLIASLAKPGGNITGMSFLLEELTAKRLELLKQAKPSIAKVGVLIHPVNPAFVQVLRVLRSEAERNRVQIEPIEVREADELESAFSTLATRGVDAIVIHSDSMFLAHAESIAALAAKHRIASVGPWDFGKTGGLIGYGVNALDYYRHIAVFVDKILKGAKPADIPVEQPTKVELVVNLKTAKALGITIPQSLLVRADEVIQ